MDQNYGFSEIFKRKTSNFIRISWIIVLSLSMFGLGFYINECYQKFKVTPEVLVNEKFVSSRAIPFPAITICPGANMKVEYLNVSKVVDQISKNLTLNLEDQRFMAAHIHSCTYGDFNSDIDSYINSTSDKDVVKTMLKIGPKVEDFLQLCGIDGHSECEKLFIRNFDPDGVCFTFNLLGYHSIFNKGMHSDYDVFKRKNITKVLSSDAKVEYHDDEHFEEPMTWSPEKGYASNSDFIHPLRANGWQFFRVRTKTNIFDLSNKCKRQIGAYKAYIHLPNERASGKNLFTYVDYDTIKFMRINAEIKKLDRSLKDFSLEQRKCYFEDEKKLRFFKTYTKNNCEYECFSNCTYKHCQCSRFAMPRMSDMRICGLNDTKCWTTVQTGWPKKYYEDKYNKENFPDYPCNCMPTCTQIKYNVLIETSTLLEKTKDNFTHTQLSIVFADSQIKETTNYVTYKIQNFVSDIGGLVGLFLGLSLLSVFEFSLNLSDFVRKYFKKYTKKAIIIQEPTENFENFDQKIKWTEKKGNRLFDSKNKIEINAISTKNRKCRERERERELLGRTVRFEPLHVKDLENLFRSY